MSFVPPEIPALNPNLLPPPVPQADDTSHFNYPGSDIVLRSGDSYHFTLPKIFIVVCSPVLRELIENVSNTSDVPNGEWLSLPVVEIPESRGTLNHLFTFIFPVAPVLPPPTEKIMELLAVAQKYEMHSVLTHIRGAISLQDPTFLRLETAFHIYFLAQQYGLHQEAVKAARVTLRLQMTIEDLGDKLDFPGMTGAYLSELWKYHEGVRKKLKWALHGFRKSGLPYDVKRLTCRGPYKRASGTSYPQWLHDYIDSIAMTPHLFDLTEFESAWACHVQDYVSGYGACTCAAMPKHTFWEALTSVVHRTIEKVRRIGVTSRTHRIANANTHRQIRP
jgi:hypothetical protein